MISYSFLCFAVRNDDNPLLLALTIQLANSLVGIFQFVIRISSDLENYMNAISRCLEYSRLPTEAILSQENRKKKTKKIGGDLKIRPLEDSFTDLNYEERMTQKRSWIVSGAI